MNYYKLIKSSIVSVLIVSSTIGYPTPKGLDAKTTKPNVLFIISDDMNCRIGCYGDPVAKTPNIDRLAMQGVRFNSAYCQAPVCNTSRSSVLSGLYPTTTGVLDNRTWLILERGQETLPEYFAKNGYAINMFGKIYHDKLNKGFRNNTEIPTKTKAVWHTPVERSIQREEEPEYWNKHLVAYRNMRNETDDRYSKVNEFGASENGANNDIDSADRAIDVIVDSSSQNKPFFLAVGFSKPHVPLKVPQKYFDLYEAEQMQLPPDFNNYPKPIPGYPEYEFRQNRDMFAGRNFSVEEARSAMKAYYACISFVDDQIGRVLDVLEKQNLTENTIIVFWGDHGWHLSEKGMWAKGTLFDVSARGPLIFVDPREKSSAGKASPRVVQFLDIYPTLIDLCGLQEANKLEGRSLRPLLEDPDGNWDYPAFTIQTRNWSIGRSVRTERWRYTEWDYGNEGSALFDHKNDPNEMVNLVVNPEYASVVKQMKETLEKENLNLKKRY